VKKFVLIVEDYWTNTTIAEQVKLMQQEKEKAGIESGEHG
jgi:hypothetical protein